MKTVVVIFGIFAYLVALVGQVGFILYLIPWDALPRTVYDVQHVPTISAVAIDIALATLFALQHSGMARRRFKALLLRVVPEAAERSVYVLLSGVVFILICAFWQPVDGIVWEVGDETLRTLLWAGYAAGWLFSLAATFVIDHFELFGLRQVYLQWKERPTPPAAFQEKLFYRFVRHPIQTGVLLALWSTPVMNTGHLVLSLLLTFYIFLGLYFEERDLVREFGAVYDDYRKRVGMLLPRKRRKGK